MFKNLIRTLFLLAGLTIGCASPGANFVPITGIPSTPTIPAASNTPAQKGTLRLATSETVNVDDIPRLIAQDSLREQGYTVELITFADFQLTTTAIIKGDVDIALGGNQTSWSAIAKGAPIRSFLGRSNNTQLLLTPTAIQHCEDLNGKKLGLSNATGSGPSMIADYVQRHCPAIKMETLIIASSNNRRIALLGGSLDATPLQTDDWLQIDATHRGNFISSSI